MMDDGVLRENPAVINALQVTRHVEKDAVTDVASQLHGLAPQEAVANIIANAPMQRLSNALDVPTANLDSSRPLHIYGVDSLVAVKLRNWFNQKLDVEFAVFEILGEVSFQDIGALAGSKSKLVRAILKGAEKQE
ncbi:hypothetical protein NHQ30_001703 [Ciborinia camelliae]|nr:hypothetical protein NHQ30_001703 [Ciborinia camelliae]